MTKSKADQIAREVRDALELIAAKHGLSFSRGGGTFSDSEFRIANIKFNKPASHGLNVKKTTAKEERDFKFYAPSHGIPADALGASFVEGRKTMTIVGWCTRKPKNPVQLVDSEGKSYKAPASWVKRNLPSEYLI